MDLAKFQLSSLVSRWRTWTQVKNGAVACRLLRRDLLRACLGFEDPAIEIPIPCDEFRGGEPELHFFLCCRQGI